MLHEDADSSVICARCGQEEETLEHRLWRCECNGQMEEEEVVKEDVDAATRGYFTLARRCEAVCRRCRTPERTRMIRAFVAENRGRGEFLRLVPSLSPALAAAQPTAPDDEVLRSWMRIKCADDDAFCR